MEDVLIILLRVTIVGTGNLQNPCSNRVDQVCQEWCGCSLGPQLCGLNSWCPTWFCVSAIKWWGEKPGKTFNLWWCNILASAVFCLSSTPCFPFLNSDSSSLLCLFVDIDYAASHFRQRLCLPACLSAISEAPVWTGASSINNNHCQSRLFRAEQSEVIWLWKAPQSRSACCDPEMLACKLITW